MKTIFYSKDAQFELTDEEFIKALVAFDKGQRIFIHRLQVSLSPLYIWAGEKTKSVRTLHDKTKAIMKNGFWVDANNPEVRMDLHYYPELAKDTDEEAPKYRFLEERKNKANL